MNYRISLAKSNKQICEAQALRAKVFFNSKITLDLDPFDKSCEHILIHNKFNDNVVCVFRILILKSAEKIDKSYSSQFYELSNLKLMSGSIIEIGRFCIDPEYADPLIIMLAWKTLRAFVEQNKASFLFGCSSFTGVDPKRYKDAFTFLKEHHIAPNKLLPGTKALKVVNFCDILQNESYNSNNAKKDIPPLLMSYLNFGGWVSDHAVIDETLDTIHVFTGLQTSLIPKNRLKFLANL